jgi:hypothetical protein
MSSWEEAIQNLFRSRPPSIGPRTVIEAIKSASENSTNPPLEMFRQRQALLDGVTDDTQSEMTPIAHTADLVTRAQYRAEGRISERESIRLQLKALPNEALFYPANILKILELD